MGINLLRSRLKLKNIHMFIIHCVRRDHDWYFVEYDDDLNRAIWSALQSNALEFNSESTVEDFKSSYLDDRMCNIVRIE